MCIILNSKHAKETGRDFDLVLDFNNILNPNMIFYTDWYITIRHFDVNFQPIFMQFTISRTIFELPAKYSEIFI